MDSSVFFIEKHPFMGVELLNLFKTSYTLFSYYDEASFQMLKKLDYSVQTYGNINLFDPIDSDKAIGLILSNKQFIERVVKKNGNNSRALFFFMSQEMNILCKKAGLKTLLPPYSIQEKLGNKVFLYDICQKLSLEANKTITFDLSALNPSKAYKRCNRELKTPFIIQGGLGVSGEDTFKVNSFREFKKYISGMNNSFRASRFLHNVIPISVHLCVTKEEILYEGPYIQIVGFKELALNPFQFAGNDTNQEILTALIKKDIKSMSMDLACYATRLGYKGIMGVDFLWDKVSNKVFVQEINSRLVGLTRLLTGIQKEQKIVPHLIKHLNEFIHPLYLDGYSNKPLNLSKYDYSQVYIANNEDSIVEVKQYLSPGIYKITKGNLVRAKNSLFLSDIEKDEVLINFSAYKGSKLKTDQLIARIILKKTVLKKNEYALNKGAINLVSLIRNYILN